MVKWKENFMLKNGQIDESLVVKKELLDTSTKGRVVERVYITPSESFILKSFTDDQQGKKEVWIQENILASFPNFYPKIIAKSFLINSNNGWIAFKDLGHITHSFTNDILHGVIKHMVSWHSLPIEVWKDAPLNGPKPKIEEIQNELLQKKEKIIDTISKGIPSGNLTILFSLLEKWEFSKSLVLSHGDLHLGNCGIAQNKLVILDWEYAHLNTRYWDLYHLIDLSHPLYPKTVTKEVRRHFLSEYYDYACTYGLETTHETFMIEYYLFSAAFSLWMTLLIVNDLNNMDRKWSENALRSQLNETIKSFNQCTEELFK